MIVGRLLLATLIIFLPTSPVASEPRSFLSDDELHWIREHPVVNFAAEPDWAPIEYVENGTYKGLASEYLRAISDATGLTFRMVSNTASDDRSGAETLAKGVDVLPAISRNLIDRRIADQLDLTPPYFVGTMVGVARDDAPILFDPQGLDGKVVAMKGGGAQEYALRQKHPEIRIKTFKGIDDALDAVADGDVDAAVGLDAVVLPALRNKHYGRLHVSGALSDMKVELAMGVRKDLPLLSSIINKSLAHLTTKQADEMVAKWLVGTGYGQPTTLTILYYYRYESAAIACALLVIGLLALRARKSERRALQSEEQKSRFLAVMSHEIRTPMNGILASIELLGRTNLDHEQRDLVGTANSASQTLLALLDDILDLSKLDANRLVIESVPTDIESSVRSVVRMSELIASRKQLPIVARIDVPHGFDVLTDPIRIRQVLFNLLSNAIKFTERGSITVSVSLRIESRTSLIIVVEDTGIGIPKAVLHTLFQPFVQAESGTARRFGGTGLGLTICRELVDRMGGTITLDSVPDMGTTVTVIIPVDTQPRLPAQEGEQDIPTQSLDHVTHTQHSILVVDDHAVNLKLFSKQLAEIGYQSKLVGSGAEALRSIKHEAFSAVLLDCNLPDMTGYDVAREIRSLGGSDLVIIAVSAATGAAHRAQCIECGMDGVLTKPVRLEEIKSVLDAWLTDKTPSAGKRESEHLDESEDITTLFARTALDDLQRLNAAMTSDNSRDACYFAHRIKGSALTVNQFEIAHAASSLEAALAGGAVVDEIQTLIEVLNNEVEKLCGPPSFRS
ncbi:Autoinducer 2 sensor kinase/phosphatase LuxQ [Pandoraea iniqua]|uniref:Virulence sensor protein BvgS n=1 Tax=Pandoraea iniqua TaxID=2508288 RepID=A0A5E4SXX8_9BURK|nr:ATP-binding protein [Pandoraea iniqua]VVD79603.1 Autoinducer 2 sensor kinase/phosphatase LuxQ [Pandoraea iniqua]